MRTRGGRGSKKPENLRTYLMDGPELYKMEHNLLNHVFYVTVSKFCWIRVIFAAKSMSQGIGQQNITNEAMPILYSLYSLQYSYTYVPTFLLFACRVT